MTRSNLSGCSASLHHWHSSGPAHSSKTTGISRSDAHFTMTTPTPSSTPIPPVIIIADRGRLKAYHLQHVEGQSSRLRLVTTHQFDEPRQRYSEKFTHQAGAFPSGGSGGQGNSTAERMLVEAEEEIRAFRRIAADITTLLQDFGVPRWAFAAPSEINGAILDGLHPALRQMLAQNLPRDLVNVEESKILAHFEKAV